MLEWVNFFFCWINVIPRPNLLGKKIYICMCMYIYFCGVLLMTNQRLHWNALRDLILFQAFSFTFVITGLEENVSIWRKIDLFYKSGVSNEALAIALGGWESPCLCPRWESEHPEEWGVPVCSLLAGLVVEAPWWWEHAFNLASMVYFHKSCSGRNILAFTFLSFLS